MNTVHINLQNAIFKCHWRKNRTCSIFTIEILGFKNTLSFCVVDFWFQLAAITSPHHAAMSDSGRPSLSPQAESFGEEVSFPSDSPSSESSNSIIALYKPPTFLS